MTTNQLVAMLFPAIPLVFAVAALLYFKWQSARRIKMTVGPDTTKADIDEKIRAEALLELDQDLQRDLRNLQRHIADLRRRTDEVRQHQAQPQPQ